MMNEAEILVKVRETIGLDWREFADRLGYTNKYSYRNIENGGVRVGPQLKKRLITIFSVRAEYLESGEGEMFSEGRKEVKPVKRYQDETHDYAAEDKKSSQEIIAELSKNITLLQEALNKQTDVSKSQAEVIRNLELRNGRITDQLLDSILRQNDTESKKEEYPIKKSG